MIETIRGHSALLSGRSVMTMIICSGMAQPPRAPMVGSGGDRKERNFNPVSRAGAVVRAGVC